MDSKVASPKEWQRKNHQPSLVDVFRSVSVPQNAGFIRKAFAFLGPGFLVSVGYMDPGNWATSIAAGAKFGYALLWITLLSNIMAIILQHLAGRLAVAAGRDLAQACRDAYGRPAAFILWLFAEVAIIATDIAEVVGTAIGLNLLFGISLELGVIITALDVFVEEPATQSPLFGTPGFMATPHLGASTSEAQINVALQVADQMAEYLTTGGVQNALNMPSLTPEEAPKLKPYMALAEELGQLAGQLTPADLRSVTVEYEGSIATLNTKPVTAAVLAGLMKSHSDTVNMVNAPFIAKDRNIDVADVRHDKESDYHTLVRLTVKTSEGERSVAGTLFANAQPRLVELFGIKVEADLSGPMLFVVNEDKPGFIGRVGTVLGEAGVNIGTFHLGRRSAGGEAVLLLSVDTAVCDEVLGKIAAVPGVKQVKALTFAV